MPDEKNRDVATGTRRLRRIVCRECDTLIYPRRSPAGPMAMICDCARPQIEAALAGLAVLRAEYVIERV